MISNAFLGQHASPNFWPRMWLLCDLTWDDLPAIVRVHPLAQWRQRLGLVAHCNFSELSNVISQLLKSHPNQHLTVLAAGLNARQQLQAMGCAPDAACALRLTLDFVPEGPPQAAAPSLDDGVQLRRLCEPEPECAQWLDATGRIVLPQPLGPYSEEDRAQWRALMQAWTRRSLSALLHEWQADGTTDDDVESVGESTEYATEEQLQSAFAASPWALESAIALYGLDPIAIEEVDRDRPAANQHRFRPQPMALAAQQRASVTSDGPISIALDTAQGSSGITSIQIRPEHRWVRSDSSLGAAAHGGTNARTLHSIALTLMGKTGPLAPQHWKHVRQVELHDSFPLPLVLRNKDGKEDAEWVLGVQDNPEIQQRFEAWKKCYPKMKIWLAE